MTNEELLAVAEIVEKLTNRYRDQEAAHKAALTEIRASFNARTSADEKIIEGLREEIIRVNEAHGRTKVVHDGLLDELAVQRDAFTANVERIRCEGRDALRAEVAALQERLRASIARGDFAQMEVAALKSQTPKHPWTFANCEPCDPPATHDTAQGKAAAESALKTEPVADEIKVGDVVEVVSNTGRNTWLADVGSVGTVVTVEEINDSISVYLENIPGKKNALTRYLSFCDVRKVTT